MQNIIFLNHIITINTPTYGNSGKISLERSRSIANGDTSNEHSLSFSNHIGTHVDSPYHFDDNGLKLTDYPPNFWVSENPYLLECKVVPEQIITLDLLYPKLKTIDPGIDCILLKTNFEIYRSNLQIYSFKNPSISPEVPIYLREHFRLKFFGVDYISIGSRSNRELGRRTHRAFLCKEFEGKKFNTEPILLLEDMKLSSLQTQPKKLWIAPLMFESADGAPTTIFADLENNLRNSV